MKRKIWKAVMTVVVAGAAWIVGTMTGTDRVSASYNYAMTGAEAAGTVTITAKPGAASVNGYGRVDGYQVTYSINRANWQAFDEKTGGYFITGNSLYAGGGCKFAYHTSGGQIWEDGAIILGYLADGTQIARCDATSDTVSCTFTAASLEQIPDYIAYAYEPAGSAYLHIENDLGINGHIWCYQSTKNAGVHFGDWADETAPDLEVKAAPAGRTVSVGGKQWGTAAKLQLGAADHQSGAGGIRIYQNGSLLREISNTSGQTAMQAEYQIGQNGVYEADCYDRLGNTGARKSVAVSCIDGEAPVISRLSVKDTDYVRQTVIIATAADSGCGLSDTAYSWNGEAWCKDKEWKAEENGTYTLKVRDALGNESRTSVTVSNIDREAPELSVNVTPAGKVMTYLGVLWSTEAELSAEAADGKSGMQEIRVLDSTGEILARTQTEEGAKAEKLAVKEIKIKNGRYKILAADVLGNNRESDEIQMTHIDGDAPVIKAIRQTEAEKGKITLVIDAADNEGGIGLAELPYSIDGGKTWQKEPVFVIDQNGTYDICVMDRLGQTAYAETKVTGVQEQKGEKTEDDQENEEPGDNPDDNPGNNPDDNAKTDENPDDGGESEENPGTEKGDQGTQAEPPKKSGITTVTGNVKKALRENLHLTRQEPSVSSNSVPKERVREKTIQPPKDYAKAEEKEVTALTPQPTEDKKTDAVQKAIGIALAALFAAGCLGLILYLLLFYLRYSCVLYAVDEEQKRCRLCRLPVKEGGDDWYIEVPDRKLGLCGTGRYLLVFHPSFAKEEEGMYVVIDIDGKTLREKAAREIEIAI